MHLRTAISGSGDACTASTDTLPGLAQLEADLNAVVEEMQSEWRQHGAISLESAERVHVLLLRARAL